MSSSIRAQVIQTIDAQEPSPSAVAAEPHFAQLMHASPVAIAITSLRHKCFVDVNPAFSRLIGYTREELIGRSSVELNLWADPIQRDKLIHRVDMGLNLDRERIALTGKSGEVRTVIIFAEIMTFGDDICLLSQMIDLTETQLQAEKLERSEAQLRALFDSAAEGILVHDRAGLITMANTSAERILGLSSTELLGSVSRNGGLGAARVDGADFPVDEHPAMRALRTGEAQFDSGMQIVRPDGKTVWISINARPIFSGDGPMPVSVVASFTDVTEQRLGEQALRESEERFRALAAAAPVGIFHTDPEGSCLFTNHRWQEIAGLSLEQSLGLGWMTAIHPNDQDRVIHHWNEAVQLQREFLLEFRFQRPNGETRWTVSRATSIRNSIGQISGYVGTVEDITERRASEEALRLSEENLRRSYDHAMTGMAIASPINGRFLSVNPAFCAMTGYSEQELLGKSPADISHPDDREGDLAVQYDLMHGRRRSYRREKRYITRSGGDLWVEVSASLVRDREGNPFQFVAQVQDISARKAAEQTLRDSEARFRALLANGADIVLLLDRNGIVRWASPSVHRTLGIDPGEIIGKSNSDMVHPDDYRTLRAAGQPQTSTLRFRHRDGSYRWLEAVGSNHLDNPAIGGVVFNARDISDRVELEERLRQEALHDPLTGLPNRSFLLDHLETALVATRRYSELTAVLFIDLNDFKPVNDRLGHAAGDQLLITIGQRLADNVRPTDVVARLGGDEFAVVLNRIRDRAEALTAMDRLNDAFALPVPIAGSAVTIRASIGLAISTDGFDTPDQLLAIADHNMYRDKKAVKNPSMVKLNTESHASTPALSSTPSLTARGS